MNMTSLERQLTSWRNTPDEPQIRYFLRLQRMSRSLLLDVGRRGTNRMNPPGIFPKEHNNQDDKKKDPLENRTENDLIRKDLLLDFEEEEEVNK